MFKTFLRAIVYTITYPARRAVTTVETFTLPPGTTPEEAAEVGTDPRELPVSSRTASEVLGTNGYGYPNLGRMTAQRSLDKSLQAMRDYLAEDARRESLTTEGV